MADREMAWEALKVLFGVDLRTDSSQSLPFTFTIARICGLSDRLTGFSSSRSFAVLMQHVFKCCSAKMCGRVIRVMATHQSQVHGSGSSLVQSWF